GLLNVGAAAAPLGALSVPLADMAAGEAADLSNTRLALGPAFGDALSGVAALRNAVAVDEFQRPYAVDLSASVASAQRGFRLADLLATGASDIVSVPPAAGMTLHMALAEDPNGDPRAQSGRSRSGGEVEAASLTGSFSPGTAWHLGMGLSADGQLGRGSTASAAGSLFWAADEMTDPHYTLLGGGDGVRLDRSLTAATTLSFGWFESDPTGNLDTGAGWGGGNIAQATVDQAFAKGGRLRLDVARVEESDTFLGSRTDGAFGSSAGAASHFVTVSGGLPVSRTIELIGSATTATTDVENAGLLSGWGTVRSTAFGIGVVARDVFDSGDRIGVLAGQPLRVGQADATVTVPVGMTADEVMVRESQRVDLAPSGREMNVQLAYRRGLWDGADLSSWLLIRNEPGHDAAASNDYGLGLSFTTTF
ncbi:MAG: hypothetical protein HKM95_09785, partial [Inquilinus sp.]|nr:hypothetical protein [Inquilinus sp.]